MKVIMLTSSIVLIMTCAAFFVYEYITTREMMRRQISTLSQIIATNCTAALAFDNHQDAIEILQALKAESNISAAALYDENGKLFAKYPASINKFYLPANPGPIGYYFTDSFLQGFYPVQQEGTRLGTIFLRSDMQAIYRRFMLYGIIAIVFIVISIIFAWVISKLL